MTKKLRVDRKAHRRKGGVKVKRTTYLTKDKGKPGRTPKGKRWFEPKRETGWSKYDSPYLRRHRLLNATDKRLTMHKRYVQAGRMANQLANVTTDEGTEIFARTDANYFFRKAKAARR